MIAVSFPSPPSAVSLTGEDEITTQHPAAGNPPQDQFPPVLSYQDTVNVITAAHGSINVITWNIQLHRMPGEFRAGKQEHKRGI